MNNVTFVTCCYSFADESDIATLNFILSGSETLKIKHPFVIFTGCEKMASVIYTIRKSYNLENITKICVIQFENLYLFKYKGIIDFNRKNYWPTKDERCNTKIHIILLSKFNFLLDAINKNYYDTSHIAWIDYNLLSKKPNNSNNYTNSNIFALIDTIAMNPKNKFSITILNYWEKSQYDDLKKFYESYKYICGGGFYTFPIDIGKKIIQQCINYSEYVTNLGFGHGEEHIFGHIIDIYENDFNLSIGDYQDLIHNYYHVTTNYNYCNKILNSYINHTRYNKIKKNLKKYDIIFCVFGCPTIDKYKKEILKINETWGEVVSKINSKLLFILGEEQTDLIGENYVYLKDVKNDYMSASYKQNLGIKYIHDNYSYNYLFVCGTDTYVNVYKLFEFLKVYNYNENLYIGGHGCNKMINNKNYYFHSGAGFLLSYGIVNNIYNMLENMTDEWIKICKTYNVNYLSVACDVCIAYYVQEKIKNLKIICNNNFFGCNYIGEPSCCKNKIILKDIIICHRMTLNDFDAYTKILKDNNYFV